MNIPQFLEKLGFGLRSLTFEDFETACLICNFLYLFTSEKCEEGMSFPRNRNGIRYRVIILRKTLLKQTLTEVAWHELYHAYYEHFGVRLFVYGSEEKYEREADDFSLCCRIPLVWVRTKSVNELLEEGFTIEEIKRRKEINDKSGGKI